MSGSHQPEMPVDPRHGRFSALEQWLRNALWVALGLAAVTLVLPERLRPYPGIALFVVLLGTPLARTAWFARRWYSRGDPKFAAVAVGVLAVVAIGVVLAAVRGS